MKKPKLYFAAPLFSQAELAFNEDTATLLESDVRVYLPQRDGGLMARMVSTGIPASVAACRVFQMDLRAINECDILLAVLDGRSIDEGVCFELGVAFQLGKICVGLQTDVRRLLSTGNNPMIAQALAHVFETREAAKHWTATASQFFQLNGELAGFSPPQSLVG